MSEQYGLWDTESGNSLGFYETQEAALEVIRQELQAYGAEAVASLALDRADGEGTGELVAEGAALIDLASKRSVEQPFFETEHTAAR